MIINTHYRSRHISTKKLSDDLSFLYHLNFQFAIGLKLEKIVLVKPGEVCIDNLESICRYFNLPFEVKFEEISDFGFAFQKVCCWDYYRKLLSEIYAITPSLP